MSLRIHGNRSLKTLPGEATRPTPARVREALFNIWLGEIEGCRWLDLCAGSGAMGAEALSRGASEVVGIDQWGKACGVIQQNWQQVAKPDQQFQVLRGDVLKRLPQLGGQVFDRIYFDPPYASDLYEPVLETIAQLQLLSLEGEMAVECDRQRQDIQIPEELEQVREKRYGNTEVRFYCRKMA